MIRNVVVGRVRDGVPADQVEREFRALLGLRVEGVELRCTAGLDLGLRPGNATYAFTVDLPDEEAYRRYDRDEEHNRVRRELFAPISGSIERVRFRLPAGDQYS